MGVYGTYCDWPYRKEKKRDQSVKIRNPSQPPVTSPGVLRSQKGALQTSSLKYYVGRGAEDNDHPRSTKIKALGDFVVDHVLDDVELKHGDLEEAYIELRKQNQEGNQGH
ncbi:hypothetical protein Tco_0319321 [Tanacetum coccineum]